MNFPASFGHAFRIGIFENEGESDTILVTGPFFSSLGNDSLIFDNSGSFFNLPKSPEGISIFVRFTILWPISVKSFVSSPISSLFIEPNALPRTGML